MGGREVNQEQAPRNTNELIAYFRSVATAGTEEEALAVFYAYESQVPQIATEKERGLRTWYEADDRTCHYFTLHANADVYHARVWKKQLSRIVRDDAVKQARALEAAEIAAKALWRTLDSFEEKRQSREAA